MDSRIGLRTSLLASATVILILAMSLPARAAIGGSSQAASQSSGISLVGTTSKVLAQGGPYAWVTVDVPAGTMTGDLLVSVLVGPPTHPDAPWCSDPNRPCPGWIPVPNDAQGRNMWEILHLGRFYRIASAPVPTSYTFYTGLKDGRPLGAHEVVSTLLAYRGVDQSAPILAASGQGICQSATDVVCSGADPHGNFQSTCYEQSPTPEDCSDALRAPGMSSTGITKVLATLVVHDEGCNRFTPRTCNLDALPTQCAKKLADVSTRGVPGLSEGMGMVECQFDATGSIAELIGNPKGAPGDVGTWKHGIAGALALRPA